MNAFFIISFFAKSVLNSVGHTFTADNLIKPILFLFFVHQMITFTQPY